MTLIQHNFPTTDHHISCTPSFNDAEEDQKNGQDPRDDKNVTTLVDNLGLDHMKLPFPYKLHMLLCDMETTGHEHIVSWVEDGKAFKIHDQKQFEILIQPRYFRQSKIASFIRQCYMYGFSKVESGPSYQGSYIHPAFQRKNQEQSLTIQRRRLRTSAGSSLQKTKSNQSRFQHYSKGRNGLCHTRVSSSTVVIHGGGMTQDAPAIIRGHESTPTLCVAFNNFYECSPLEQDDSFFASLDLRPPRDLSELQRNMPKMVRKMDHFLDENCIDAFLEPISIKEESMLSPLL